MFTINAEVRKEQGKGASRRLRAANKFPAIIYGDLKAIVKTSHLVKIDYPKFIVHGTKGSFVKYGIDQ
ncbi:hypothetical protein MJN51_15055, partial [Salmonella enterica subsp. enterica serovar Kentucky]|nr:hypothetical protein [Salmonella enterica subsp. enterica serovar Kentucky]